MALFEPKKIVKVDLLGVTTGFETKVLATYNFPVYNFLIHYDDGSTEHKEIAADGYLRKAEIDKLLKYTNTNDAPQVAAAPVASLAPSRDKSAVYDDLKKIKDLFDAGILTEEMYEKEKKELLDELSSTPSAAAKAATVPTIPHNLIIHREKKRPWGEDKVVIVLDGKRREDLDTDSEVRLSVSPGSHSLQFRRGLAAKSQEYSVKILADKATEVTILAKPVGLLGLQAEIKTKM